MYISNNLYLSTVIILLYWLSYLTLINFAMFYLFNPFLLLASNSIGLIIYYQWLKNI